MLYADQRPDLLSFLRELLMVKDCFKNAIKRWLHKSRDRDRCQKGDTKGMEALGDLYVDKKSVMIIES